MNQEIFDAIQALKEIGVIGVHEHFRGWGGKGTIEEWLNVAEKLGFKVICDMPNNIPPTISEETLLARLEAARKSRYKKVKYMAWIGLTADPWQIEEAVRLWRKYPEVAGLKMFAGKSTQSLALITEDEQRLVYQILARLKYKGVIAVHCEDEKYIFEKRYDPKKPWTHALARPKIAEIFSISQQIKLVKETGFPGWLHICHVSCHDSVEMIAIAKNKGICISCGITPHMLLYSIEQMEKMGRIKSLLLKCNPPIRDEANRILLWKDLQNGKIDLIETDHAPHTVRDKLNNASGVPGMLLLPKLYVEMKKKNFTDKQIKELLRKNALRIFPKIKDYMSA